MNKCKLLGLICAVVPALAASPRAYVLSSDPSFKSAYLSVFDTGSYQQLAQIAIPTEAERLILNPNGKFAYTRGFYSNTTKLTVISTATDQVVKTLDLGNAHREIDKIRVTPEGKVIWITRGDGTITLVCGISNVVLASVRIPDFGAIDVTFSPDSKLAYVAGWDATHPLGKVKVLSTASQQVIASFTMPRGYPEFVTISPDRKSLYVVTQEFCTACDDPPASVWIVNTSDGTIGKTFNLTGYVQALILRPDGKELYVSSTSGSSSVAYFLDSATLGVTHTSGAGEEIAYAPNSAQLWVLPTTFSTNWNPFVWVESATDDSVLSTVTLNDAPAYLEDVAISK